MEHPIYSGSQKVGGLKSSYSLNVFPSSGLQSAQSFILETTFVDEQNPAQPFDISNATASIYITAYKVEYTPVLLASGVISDSGSGTLDKVSFTIQSGLIPEDIALIPRGRVGNGVIYFILEETGKRLQFSEVVNITDTEFLLTADNSASSNVIVTNRNDLGTVINISLTIPPSNPSFNDSYIIAVGATGDWLNEDGNLAVWNGVAWIYKVTEQGNFVFDSNTSLQYVKDGSGWSASAGNMSTSTYDPANISEQVVGLTATQSLTNKTVNGVNLISSGSASLNLRQDGSYSAITASEVGNNTAQWNANQLQDNTIQDITLAAGQDGMVPTWNNTTGEIEWQSPPGLGGGEANTLEINPSATGLDITSTKAGTALRIKGINTSGAISAIINSEDIDFTIDDSSETQKGAVELATSVETGTGISTSLAVHPAGLKANYSPLLLVPDIKPSGAYTTNDADNGKWIIVDGAVTLHTAGQAGINILIQNSTSSPINYISTGLTKKGDSNSNISAEKAISVRWSQTNEIYVDGGTE